MHRFLLGIDGASDRLARLIGEPAQCSAHRVGQFRLSTQRVDLIHLVANAVATARISAKDREITLGVPDRPVPIEGDRCS